MTVTIHRDCRPTLDLRICRRECWIDSEEIVATSSDRRVDACCLHCTPSARKQGQQDTRALCIHRIRSHSIESLFVTSSSLSWRHLYFIAYINISDGWHMQNKCWFFIKCIYEFPIIPSPSLSANYAPLLLLVNPAAVPLCTRYIEAALQPVTTTRTSTMKLCLLLAALAIVSTSVLGDAGGEALSVMWYLQLIIV